VSGGCVEAVVDPEESGDAEPIHVHDDTMRRPMARAVRRECRGKRRALIGGATARCS